MEVGGVIGACGNFDKNPPPPKEGGDIYFYLDQNQPPPPQEVGGDMGVSGDKELDLALVRRTFVCVSFSLTNEVRLKIKVQYKV